MSQIILLVALCLATPSFGCDLNAVYKKLTDTQCNICSKATDSVCRDKTGSSTTDLAVQNNCDWTLLHGCRPSGRVSLFAKLLEDSEHFTAGKKLLDIGKECSLLGHDRRWCYGNSKCEWGQDIDPKKPSEFETNFFEKLMAAGTTSPCKMRDSIFVSLLLGLVDGSPKADSDALVASAQKCHQLCDFNVQVLGKNANEGKHECDKLKCDKCGTFTDAWLAGDRSLTGMQLPCVAEDDGLKGCGLSFTFIELKLGAISGNAADLKFGTDAFACEVAPKDKCKSIGVPGCQEKGPEDDGCERNETVVKAERKKSPAGMRQVKAREECDATKNKTACNKDGGACHWEVEWDNDVAKEECKFGPAVGGMSEIGWAISNNAGPGQLGWVNDFLIAVGECGDLVNKRDKNDNKPCSTNSECRTLCVSDARCEFTPAINGTYGRGDCSAHLGTAFKSAVKDQPKCAEQLANAIHAAIGCEANTNEQDCKDAKHHPTYTCEWTCGTCIPTEDYFPTITTTKATTITTKSITTTPAKGSATTTAKKVVVGGGTVGGGIAKATTTAGGGTPEPTTTPEATTKALNSGVCAVASVAAALVAVVTAL